MCKITLYHIYSIRMYVLLSVIAEGGTARSGGLAEELEEVRNGSE